MHMFKIKQITPILAAALLFLGGCGNNEDILPDDEQQLQMVSLPTITAQIGKAANTRAGVVENNSNYADGERFRWSVGDEVTMHFYQNGTAKYEVTYVAGSADATNPNLCTFTPKVSTTIAAGRYDIYGVYATPTATPTSNNIGDLTQRGNNSSAHLNGQLLMKGQVLNAALTAESTTLEMRFNHLTSVVRYVVTNNTGNADLKVNHINLTSSTSPFVLRAYLSNIYIQALTLSNKNKYATLSVTDGAFDADNTFHGFTRVLTEPEAITDLTVTLVVENNGKRSALSKAIPAASLANVLGEGFRPGYSYYFRLNINSTGLEVLPISAWEGTEDEATEGEFDYPRYQVGDFYPNPNNRATAKGVVYKVDAEGRHGKAVYYQEETGQWSTEADLIGATDDDNGLVNMRAVQIWDDSYSYYPAFGYVNRINENLGINTNEYADPDATGVWYLPAKNELTELLQACNKDPEINNSLNSIPNGDWMSLSGAYWSSTEYTDYDLYDCAYYQDVPYEVSRSTFKEFSFHVRPIISF